MRITGQVEKVFLFPDQVEDKCHPGLDPGSRYQIRLIARFETTLLDSGSALCFARNDNREESKVTTLLDSGSTICFDQNDNIEESKVEATLL